jgi:hypothetical protein
MLMPAVRMAAMFTSDQRRHRGALESLDLPQPAHPALAAPETRERADKLLDEVFEDDLDTENRASFR